MTYSAMLKRNLSRVRWMDSNSVHSSAANLKRDPLSGALFLFVNHRRDRIKVFYWDGEGLAIWYRRLEYGTSQVPASNDQLNAVKIRGDEFTMLLRSIDLSSVKRRKRSQLASWLQVTSILKTCPCTYCSRMISKSIFYINYLFCENFFCTCSPSLG